MTYDFECKCGKKREVVRSIKDDSDVLCKCGKRMTVSFENLKPVIYLKGSWPGKNIRESNYRAKRKEIMKKVQRAEYGDDYGPKLLPNVNGEVCENWKDAKSLAKEKGLKVGTYDKMVRKESKKKLVKAKR